MDCLSFFGLNGVKPVAQSIKHPLHSHKTRSLDQDTVVFCNLSKHALLQAVHVRKMLGTFKDRIEAGLLHNLEQRLQAMSAIQPDSVLIDAIAPKP